MAAETGHRVILHQPGEYLLPPVPACAQGGIHHAPGGVDIAEEVGLQFYAEARRHKRNWASKNEKLVVGARSRLSDL